MALKDDASTPNRIDASASQPQPDPTLNVQNLLLAAVKRIDDLNEFRDRHTTEMRNAESNRLNGLREAEIVRVNDSIEAERRRVDEQIALRTSYEGQLREAEAKRIDAIRVVDVNAVAVANERATAQATVLATQVAASADTLRTLVATTAATTAAAVAQQFQQVQQVTGTLSDRLAIVERANYEGTGRAGVADPALTATLAALAEGQRQAAIAQAESQKAMASSIAELAKVQQTNTGKGLGAAQVISYVIAGVLFLSTIIGLLAYVQKP